MDVATDFCVIKFLQSTMRLWITILVVLVSVAMASAKPRLVVLLCYDQLRGDRLEAVEPWLGERGFRRLLREGVVARRCLFDYATTVTAAGHATIATGCNPSRHGIVGNDFVVAGRAVYATDDTALGAPSPRLLLVPTLGDYLRRAYPQSKVWSFSHKDRGAVFLGGFHPQGAYWLEPGIGLGSSAYYPPPPAWLQQFNQQHSPTRYAGAVWNAQLPASAPADSVPWEGRFPAGGNCFPHVLPGDTSGEQFWHAFALTPYAVEWLFRAAQECIRAEGLGSDDVPDLLSISVSTTDFVGHLFGQDSREYAELLIACDRILAAFLDSLDRWVGRERYMLVLTSDHGAGSIPELQRQRGHDAGRIRGDTLAAWVARWAAACGGDTVRTLKRFFPPWIWLDSVSVAACHIPHDSAATAVARFLRQQQGIAFAYSRAELEHMPDSGIVRLIRHSYHPDRCGDVVVYPKPQWIFGSTPAQHGTPYDYDRWVPLIFFGDSLVPHELTAPCSPTDIVPTVLDLLGIAPAQCDGHVLPIFRTKPEH